MGCGGMGCVMKGLGGVHYEGVGGMCYEGVGCVMEGWGVSWRVGWVIYRGGVGCVMKEWGRVVMQG